MSFSSEYNKLRKKRLQEQMSEDPIEERGEIAPLLYSKNRIVAKGTEDIAPVKETVTEETEERKWFNSGLFEDGYQFGDVFKTLLATGADIKSNIGGGLLEIGEGVVDAGAYLAGGIGGLLGADEFAENTKEFIAKDLYDGEKIASYILSTPAQIGLSAMGVEDYDDASILGEKTDSLAQSGGQLLGTIGLQAVGVPWFLTSGVTSFGQATESAFGEGANYVEAGVYGGISAGAEILTEKLFGGSGLGEKGLINLEPLTKGIANKFTKSLVDLGVDMAAEGTEEVISSFASRFASKLYKEENLEELLFSEEAFDEYLESYIGGAALGGVMNAAKVNNARQPKGGIDYRSGLTTNEEKVVNKEYENRIAEAEKDGAELSKKDKAKIYDEVREDFEKGDISIDTIESVIGGEDAFKTYNDLKAEAEEYKTLYETESGKLSEAQRDRLAELKAKNADNSYETMLQAEKDNISKGVLDTLAKERKGAGSGLIESYNERARRGQAFEADLTKYDAKQQAVVKKAVESGILNNTRRTHDFVDMVAKISADKGVLFDFTNNERLKDSGFAIEGKAVNGYVTKDGITVNINSAKSLNSVVGHEITHILEGTELYTELQNALFEYAKTKKDYQGRYDTLTKLYEGVKDADVNAELTADLVGDYLFTDSDFVRKLSVEHRNVFQKIYDEIKYLCKIATAGSKEARELEKVKRAFDKAYKEGSKADGDTKYSLSDSDGKKLTKEQNEYFKDSKMRDDNGNLMVMYHGSQNAGFHVFDPSMSDDDTSFFFVDRNDVAASYSGTTETYEARTIRSAEDMNNFLAEIGYDEDYSVVEKDGKFTLLYEGERVADSNTAQGIYEEFCWYEGVGEGDANYKVYLNLKNPLVVDAEGRNWNNISREYSQEIADRYNSLTADEKAALANLAEWGEYSIFRDQMLEARANEQGGGVFDEAYTKNLASAYEKLGGANANLYDAFSIASDNFSEESIGQFAVKQMNTRDYAKKAKAEGYDGVIFKNIHDNGGYSNGSEGASTVAIAFESNQIKSVANAKPTEKADIRYSLSDTKGRELSKEQREYFRESKVVDANGNLKVMYHGTPSGKFTVFKDGTYFTENKWYADLYQNPGASSISTGKVATDPKTYEVYLDIKKPFDINDAEARKIYINDYIKGGNAVGINPYLSDAEYAKIRSIDWTEGEDLRDFLIDNGYDYDGLVLDEGAVGGFGEDVKYRGKSYVIFSPEQVKNVDNKTPTSDPDIRFSLSEYTAEEKKAHNKAVLEHFGKTYSWAETGYLLLDGTRLDLSGKHEGAPGGYRTVDHRDIVDALGSDYGNGDYSGSLVQFMSEGNIRIIPECNGINLSVKPTEAQERALSNYISRYRGEVLLDIDDLNGNTVVSVEYPYGTYYTTVLNDIREWFDNGKKPENSGSYSLTKDGETPQTYGSYNVYGKDLMLEKAPGQETIAETGKVEDVAPTKDSTQDSGPVEASVSSLPNYAENQIASYKNAIAEERANAKGARKPSLTALKRLVVTKPRGRAEHHGALVSDGKQYMTCNGGVIVELNTPDKSIVDNNSLAVESLKNAFTTANNNIIDSGYEIDSTDISLIRKQLPKGDNTSVVVVGDNCYDIRYVDAVLKAIENPTISLSTYKNDFNFLLVKGSNGQAAILPLNHKINGGKNLRYVYKAEKVGTEQIAPDGFAPVSEAEANAMQTENIESITDADAPIKSETAYYGENENVTPSDPFESRDIKAVGSPKVNAYVVEHPEALPYFQEAANAMLGDLQNTVRGERHPINDADGYIVGWDGTRRQTTDDLAYLLDNYNYTYEQIEKALNSIIEGNGKYNAVAKRIEFLLNDRLMKGYTDVSGYDIPPNQDYINLLSQQQTADAVNRQGVDAIEHISDDIAPIRETITAEKYTPKYKAAPIQEEKIAQIVDADTTKPKRRGIISLAKEYILDNGRVFEDLAKKTKNRELEARWNSIRYSDGMAQGFIKNGENGVKSIEALKNEVEKAGLAEDFEYYMYHRHNVDRMSLESRVAPKIAELQEQLGLDDAQIAELANEKIKHNTPKDEAAKIRSAREYVRLANFKNKAVFGDSETADVSKARVAEWERKHPVFKQWAEDVYANNKYLRQLMIDEGLITQETADLWDVLYPHYVPIRRTGHDGAAVNVPLDSNKTGVNAPIKRATGGNSDFYHLFDTMGTRAMQTYKAIAKNRFGVELKNTLGSTIEQTDATLDDAMNVDAYEELLKEGKHGMNPTFTVFEDGKRVEFEITEEMYDALRPSGDALSYTNPVLNKLGNLRRGLLTEYNPTFMLTNAIKDAQDVLINSQHPAKTYANLPRAAWQMITSGEYYKEYMEHGGEDNTYFEKDTNTFKKEKSAFVKALGMPLNAISKANNFIERLPRLAEYMASREAGRSIDVSMLDAARVTTNFAAGGKLTKLLNRNGVTFLNASVQGAVQQVRNVQEAKINGFKGWVGLATKYAMAGLPALLLNHLLWDDDEEYEELSDYVKDNYYIVAKTEDGLFVRIPKGRAVAVIQNAFEQMENLVTGDDEVDFERFFDLVKTNLAPNSVTDNHILAPIQQVRNNEAWYGGDLVPTRLQNLPKAEQYDESTDEISKWLGEKLDYSPYKINYLLDQYLGGVGDVILPALTPDAERGDGNIVTAPFLDKFTTDPVMKNQTVSDFYSKVDELTVNANSSKATDGDILMSKYMNSVNTQLSELYQQKREIQNGNLPDAEKYEQVRDIQQQIVDIARESLNAYENVNIDNDYATVGDRHFIKNDKGEWQKVTDKQLEKEEEVTSGLGINASEYWSNKDEYDFAYEYPEKYAVAKSVGGYDAYKTYASELYDIMADKDEDGKSISGSRKEKVIEYINNLDADYGEKIILFKGEYPADDTYNYEIIDYLNSREDISYAEMETILKELGFTVRSDGTVQW